MTRLARIRRFIDNHPIPTRVQLIDNGLLADQISGLFIGGAIGFAVWTLLVVKPDWYLNFLWALLWVIGEMQ